MALAVLVDARDWPIEVYWPPVVIALAIVSATFSAAYWIVRSRVRGAPTWIALRWIALLLALVCIPIISLGADVSNWGWLIMALVGIAVTGTLLFTVHRARRWRRPAATYALAAGFGLSIPWVAFGLEPLFAPEASVSQYLGWSMVMFCSAAVMEFGAFGAVLFAAESRHAVADQLTQRSGLSHLPELAVVLAAVVIALRFTIARDWFGRFDAALWFAAWPGSISSWTISFVAAYLIVMIVRSSAERRRQARGRTTIVLLLIATAAPVLLFDLAHPAFVVSVAYSRDWRVASTRDDFIWGAFQWGHLFALALAIVAVVIGLLPTFAGSSGRAVAVIAAVTVIPDLVWTAFPATRAAFDRPRATQVVVLIVALTGILMTIDALRRNRAVFGFIQGRLILVSLIVVHAAVLFPALVESYFGWMIVVLGIVVGLAWGLPPVASNRMRHSEHVLTASAAALVAVVALFAFVLWESEQGSTEFATDLALAQLEGIETLTPCVVVMLSVFTRPKDPLLQVKGQLK